MNKSKVFAGSLLICGAIGFFVSWSLMPDPGTTDTAHILDVVKQSRSDVINSVIIQIITSVIYIAALFMLTQISFQLNKLSLVGICLVGVGVLGLCSDAFFHLLAWFMTDDSVNTQKDVVRVMEFMQTDGVRFLIPILLPFFFGGLILAIGLKRQRLVSRLSAYVITLAFLVAVIMVIATKTHVYNGPVPILFILGIFAIGHAIMGFECLGPNRRITFDHAAFDVYQ